MLRDHGFDKYEGALAALCPVERRQGEGGALQARPV